MTLNKVKQGSNMYSFLNDGGYKGKTWNPLGGKCRHLCEYCSTENLMRYPATKEKYTGKLRLIEHELKNLGSGNFIFVCAQNDLFQEDVSEDIIFQILGQCVKYHNNKYLFQSKNTARMYKYRHYILPGSIIGTTIETNRNVQLMKISNAPVVEERAYFLGQMDSTRFKRMLTIEPIMNFDVNELVTLARMCRPDWVNIGADSKKHNLPEPSKEKLCALIKELEKFTKVKLKPNIYRLMKDD